MYIIARLRWEFLAESKSKPSFPRLKPYMHHHTCVRWCTTFRRPTVILLEIPKPLMRTNFYYFCLAFFPNFIEYSWGCSLWEFWKLNFPAFLVLSHKPLGKSAGKFKFSEFFRANIRLEFWYCTFSVNTILKLPHFLREIQNSVNKKWTLSDF